MHKTLTVVTMLWNGWGAGRGVEYVYKLFNMVNRHLSLPFQFVLFTDQEHALEIGDSEKLFDVKIIPQEILSWPLNLPKFYMYCPDNGLEGRILFMDLDTVIVGSLDEMASYGGVFCGIKPFRKGRTHIGGGFLSFEVGYGEYLWKNINKDPKGWAGRTQGGKERLVYKQLVQGKDRWQDLYPGQLVGYKRHCRGKGIFPEGARFIAFHGKPRPHEVKERWVKKNWK